MKLIITILCGLLLMLQYALWFGDKSMFDLYNITQTTKQTQRENIAMQQHNDKLVAEVNDLKEGGETVETVARSQFGLIKPDETFYQIID